VPHFITIVKNTPLIKFVNVMVVPPLKESEKEGGAGTWRNGNGNTFRKGDELFIVESFPFFFCTPLCIFGAVPNNIHK